MSQSRPSPAAKLSDALVSLMKGDEPLPPPGVKNGHDEAYHQLLKIRSQRGAVVTSNKHPVSKFRETSI